PSASSIWLFGTPSPRGGRPPAVSPPCKPLSGWNGRKQGICLRRGGLLLPGQEAVGVAGRNAQLSGSWLFGRENENRRSAAFGGPATHRQRSRGPQHAG